MPETEDLLGVVRAVIHLSGAFAAEMFCDGALSALLRIAQRLVAAQPHAGREQSAIRLFREGVARVVCTFAHAVPQARPHIYQHPRSRSYQMQTLLLWQCRC